jgi:hypothetical protein
MTRHCTEHLVWYDYAFEGEPSRWLLLDLTRPHPTARGGFLGLGDFPSRPACVAEHQRICERVRLTDDPEDEPEYWPEPYRPCRTQGCTRHPAHVGPCRVPAKEDYL